MTCLGLGATMRRREFLGAMIGAATTALPPTAHAQQPTTPLIGFLHPGSPEANTSALSAFRKGLGEAGYTEGRNVAIEFRWAHGDNSRLSELAADLARRQVAVIVSALGTATALAAKAATPTIPIVFSAGTDPVGAGIVASLSRPGGNITRQFHGIRARGQAVGYPAGTGASRHSYCPACQSDQSGFRRKYNQGC